MLSAPAKALKESQIACKTPYSTRHSFCAWALTIGVNPMKVVNLMGHSSKQMVYQVYGDYVEDLEDDVDDIIRYFGVYFLIKPDKKLSQLLTYGDSLGAVGTLTHLTYWINYVFFGAGNEIRKFKAILIIFKLVIYTR